MGALATTGRVAVTGALVASAGLVAFSASPATAAPVRERCQASYYSGVKSGKNTLTAAHKTLPKGTVVMVVERKSGKRVNVTITDRGPYVKGRCIDLSKQAFKKLRPLSSGVANVGVHIVKMGKKK